MITQPIALTVSAFDFNYTLQAESYIGDLIIIVQCYKNIASKTVVVNYNFTIVQVNDTTVDISDNSTDDTTDDTALPWHHTLNPKHWWDSFKHFFNGNIFNGLKTGLSWFHWLLLALEIVAFAIVGVIFIMIIVKVSRFVPWRRIFMMKTKSKMAYNSIKMEAK
jgi:hypothetical protein